MTKKPKISALARRLLFKTIDSIIAKPEAFNQGESGSFYLTDGYGPSCNTPMCILGWMHHHRMMEVRGARKREAIVDDYRAAVIHWQTHDIGKRVGLDGDQGEKLFCMDFWPKKFQAAEDRHVKARVAARRIRHFLETGE